MSGKEEFCWIELTDIFNELNYIWIDGNIINYTNWESKEPDNNQNQDYRIKNKLLINTHANIM